MYTAMSDKIELTVEDRQVHGKAVKTLRKHGYVPAVIYGDGVTPQNVMALQPQMVKVYRAAGRHHPIELLIGRQKRLAMIKTADIDPVKHTLRHVAFHAIKQNEIVETQVPIVITGLGETPAEKAGLVILTNIDKVDIEALPSNLPDAVQLPGEKLATAGDRATVADLVVPQGVTITSDLDQVVATVYEPSALVAQNEAAAGEAETAEADVVTSEHGEQAEVAPKP
jgi:large subunit ribosomal protein L25